MIPQELTAVTIVPVYKAAQSASDIPHPLHHVPFETKVIVCIRYPVFAPHASVTNACKYKLAHVYVVNAGKVIVPLRGCHHLLAKVNVQAPE